jgi:hypothetical protein
MPYIDPKDRDVNAAHYPHNAGELNYAITLLIRDYFRSNGGRYQQINDIIGALEGAKAEFYRRVVAPYEDIKIRENGDVY